MQVICISGKAGHGKDTLATYMFEILKEAGKKVLITHYADLLKYVCRSFFGWNGKKDEAGRTLLQTVGTDMYRASDENYWTDFICTVLQFCADRWDFVLIPDCRFPNEISRLRDSGFDVIHIMIDRHGYDTPLTEAQQQHASETAIDAVVPDVVIHNAGTEKALRAKAAMFLKVNFDIDDISEMKCCDEHVHIGDGYIHIGNSDRADLNNRILVNDSMLYTNITQDDRSIIADGVVWYDNSEVQSAFQTLERQMTELQQSYTNHTGNGFVTTHTGVAATWE